MAVEVTNPAVNLGVLLGFLNQNQAPVAKAADIKSLMLPIPGNDPHSRARRYKEKQASLMAEKADEIYGTPQMGQEQQTLPYVQSNAEMMEGEAPIQGLEQIIQQQSPDYQAATGIYDKSVPVQQRIHEMNKRMLAAGVPGFNEQWAGNQRSMQNSMMQNAGLMAGKRFDAMNPLTSKIKEYQYSQANPGFLDYQTTIGRSNAPQMNVGSNMYVSPEEASKMRYKDGRRVDPFTPKADLVGKVRAISATELKDMSGAKKSVAIVDEMDNMLFGSFGIFKDFKNGEDMSWDERLQHTWTSNVQQIAQTDPRYKQFVAYAEGTLAPFAKSLGQAGSLSDTDLELVENLVPKLTGLNPDTPSVAKEKLMKMRRLISAGLEDVGKITTETLYSVIGNGGGAGGGSGTPQIGSVVDGYVFIGGDPNDQANWVESK